MFGVLPMLFALLIAYTAREYPPSTAPQSDGASDLTATFITLTASLIGWWVLNLIVVRVLQSRGERMGQWWDHIATMSTLIMFAGWCRYANWAHMSEWSIILLIPFILLSIIGWRAAALIACSGSRRAASQSVSIRVRFSLVPVVVAITLFDVLQLLVLEPALNSIEEPSGLVASIIAIVSLMAMPIIVLSALPPLVARMWRAQPMPPGPERDLLAEGCAKAGVKVGRIWHWPTAGGQFYNAAVMGLLPQTRYVLFSDDLLRDLPPQQLVAVLGHELGHIRHRHLFLYLLYLAAGSMWVSVTTEPVTVLLLSFSAIDEQLLHSIVMIGLFFLVLRVGFGVVSRLCERQADLAGATLAGSTQDMANALHNVAMLSGQDIDTPSWRHHSIRERIDYLASVEQEPKRADEHHTRVRAMTWAIIACLVMVPFLGLSVFGQGRPDVTWFDDHPVALNAFEQAEEGDPTSLREWLEVAPIEDRAAVAFLALNATAEFVDMPTLYNQRQLLLPFIGVELGNPELAAWIANNAAYAAVGGARHPTEEDIDLAWQALPTLRQAAFDAGLPSWHDTVGCIYFVKGERAQARSHFSAAIELMNSGKDKEVPDPEAFRTLLNQRLAACDDAEALLPLEFEPSDIEPEQTAEPAFP